MKPVHNGFVRWTSRVVLFSMLLLSCGFHATAAAATLAAGTPVTIRTTDMISSKTNNVGNNIMAVVATDVVKDGKVLIAAGAPVTGRVMSVTKATLVGMPGNINVRFESVQAVNGTTLSLMKSDLYAEGESKTVVSVVVGLLCCILAFLINGTDAQILPDTTVTAYTAAEVQID